MNQKTTQLVLFGVVMIIILNFFIFYEIRVSETENQVTKKVAVDILERQLARKENRIRELESQSCQAGGKKPPQVLPIGWEWSTRATRKVKFFDGNEAFVYKTTYEGSMASPDRPSSDWWDKIETRSWEIDTFFVYKTFLGPESTLIDFGAWIGPTLLYGATLAKYAYALEPDPYAFDELRANVALNPKLQDHTWVFWKCIMDKPGIFSMGGGGGDSMATVGTGAHPKTWKVDCQTLPQFIEEHHIENIDLIKMDTEGAEHIILPSFKDWLSQQKKKPTIWLSIHKWNFGPDGERAILDVLKLYKRVYEGHQTPVNIGQYTLCNFCTILATDLDVAIYNE